MVYRKILVGLTLWVLASMANAACSGSGTSWSCTAGSTKANVNSAMASATSGATITMAAGSYTWTSGSLTPDPLKSVTVICATVGGCNASLGTSNLWYHDDINGATSKASQKTWRLSGFNFTGSCGAPCIWIYPRISNPTQYLTLRLDHNTFTNVSDGTDFAYFGEGVRPMVFKGVFDNNTWTNNIQTRIVVYGTGNPANWSGSLMGAGNPESGNCLFLENNTVNFTAPSNNGLGFIDGENAACYVLRFNNIKNARVLQHGVTHGWGTSNFEVYKNTFTRTSNGDGLGNCQRSIHMQGSGTGAFWGNTFTACVGTISGDTIALLHYRDGTPADAGYSNAPQCDGTYGSDGNTSPITTHRGYPCYHQPGRAPGGNKLFPIPYFNNVGPSGQQVNMSFDCPWTVNPIYCAEHIQANRDYYEAVSVNAQTSATSPFNGTTGIGHGTFARRPTTCTHTVPPDGDAGNNAGVMYWATDAGNWNGFAGAAQGILYRCSATNTWTPYYSPYPYPHPLRVQGGPTPPVVN